MSPAPPVAPPDRVRAALDLLGIRHFLLGIQDAAYPAEPGADVGRGSPYSAAAEDLLAFAAERGFSGLQLGPQGATSSTNPSPYDGTLFSRNPVSLALGPLAGPEWGEVLPADELAALVAGRPGPDDRVAYRYAYASFRRVVEVVAARVARAVREGDNPAVAAHAEPFARFRARNADWLERDGLYGALKRRYRGRHFAEWPDEVDRRLYAPRPGDEERAAERRRELRAAHGDEILAWSLVQYVLHVQHSRMRERARRLGLDVFGDLQVGFSPRDAWVVQGFVMPGYRMGAPPSRTNPEGQPWGYPVLDPAHYWATGEDGARRPGPAQVFVQSRALRMFEDFDGVRVDHPHGFVCPWVYRSDGKDVLQAVQDGARLFASPDLPAHAALAPHAIVRPDQLDRTLARHADGWVRELDDDQVTRYAALFDVIVGAARRSGREADHVACEILSTQPYPLGRVIERHGLGRFRVTQKADLSRPDDVYRGEHARPRDWVMLGNHDTRPIWAVARDWDRSGSARDQAAYLASRLLGPGEDTASWVSRVAADRHALVQAKFAELFAGPAANVMVFFTDLFGLEESYNRPGVVSEENWSLRLPPDFASQYAAGVARGAALDVPRAVARALRSRGPSFVAAHRTLVEDLER